MRTPETRNLVLAGTELMLGVSCLVFPFAGFVGVVSFMQRTHHISHSITINMGAC